MRKIRLAAMISLSLTFAFALAVAAQAGAQSHAAAGRVEIRPFVTITSPADGATLTSSPVTVTGTAGANSGVKSVTVNGVGATLYTTTWSARVPLTHGQNTLTATMTPKYGSGASASVNVTYTGSAAAAHVTLVSDRFNGGAVLVKLACSAGSNCAGKVTLRYTETVVKHHKKRRITLVLAGKSYAVGAGRTATITAGLSAKGKSLLKTHHKLATKGTVTVTQANGDAATAATFKLTLK
jgi:hypothetical protein